MTIELTTEEYRRLLNMVQIARWVLHAHKTNTPPQTRPYNELEQKIASYAVEMKMDDTIVYDDHLEGYFPTAECEAEYLAYIDDYDNDVFWDELASRLAERDLVDAEGEEQVLNMDGFERVKKLGKREDTYIQEFIEHGLENLAILKAPFLRTDLTTRYEH